MYVMYFIATFMCCNNKNIIYLANKCSSVIIKLLKFTTLMTFMQILNNLAIRNVISIRSLTNLISPILTERQIICLVLHNIRLKLI